MENEPGRPDDSPAERDAPESEAPPSRWAARRKRLLIAGLAALAIVLLLVVSTVFFVRLGGLDSYVEGQVKAALSEYGVRAEFGSFELTFGTRTAETRDVKFYNKETGQLIATVDRAKIVVEIPGLFAPRLRRDVIFKTLDIENLHAYVTVDEQGRTNFRGLHAPPPKAPSRIAFDFSALVGALDGGTLHVDDRAHRIEGELGNLKASARPLPDEARAEAQFSAGPGRLVYEGRETSVDALELVGRLGNAGADIERFVLRSPLGEATIAGRVDDWGAPRPDLTVQTRVALGEAGRVFAPDAGLEGSAAFDGRLTGDGQRYQVAGGLTADELALPDGRARGVSVDELRIELDGDRIAFAGTRASADALATPDAQLAGVAASGVRGEVVDGTTQASLDRVTIGSVAASQTRLSGVALANVTASVGDAGTSFASARVTAGGVAAAGARLTGVAAAGVRGSVAGGATRANVQQVTIAGVATAEGRLSGVTLRNAVASVRGGGYQLTGDLAVASGDLARVDLGRTRGRLAASNGTVALERFDAAVAGGTASGDLVLRTGRGGTSRLTASFTGLRTNDLFRIASPDPAPLAGTTSGRAELSWPGTNVEAASGTITAHLDAQTAQTTNAIPVTGDVSVRARGGVFDVDQLVLATDASRLEASGQVSPRGDSDLRFTLTSTNAEQLQEIANSIDRVAQALAPYEPRLAGDLRFEGRLSGPLRDPSIEGDVSAGSVGAYGTALGSLVGHVRVSPAEIAFENGTLTATNGGTAKFAYAAPRAEGATSGRFDATIDRLDVGTVAAVGGVSPDQQAVTGQLSGEVHVTGLPAAPQGTAALELVDGTIAGQPTEVATARVLFDGKSARIERAEVRTAQGQFVASGGLDFENGEYQLDGNAEDVDLSRLAAAFGVTATRVTGIVDATVKVSGDLDDSTKLDVQATAQGQDVTVNGQNASPLTLTARTNASGRLDVEFVTGVTGSPQTVRATVELSQLGRPALIESDFADVALGPLLTALAPDLAPSVAGTVSGRLRVAGPIEDESGETTLDRLEGTLALETVSLEINGQAFAVQTPLTVSLDDGRVALAQTRVTGPGTDLRLGGTLGIAEGAALDFALAGTVDLGNLGQLDPDTFVDGNVVVDARAQGTTAAPRLAGEIRATDLAFSGTDLPVEISGGTARVALAGDRINLESFTARANDGTLDASGSIQLAGLAPSEWRFTATARNVEVLYEGALATLDGDFTLTGTPDRQLLAGTVRVPEGEYTTDFDFDALMASGASGGGFGFGDGGGGGGGRRRGRRSGFPPVHLNLRVDAPGTLLIRNEQVNTVATAALTIGGTLEDPSITGRISVEGGTIKFRTQRYDITAGTIDFPGGGAQPFVNVQTEGDVSGYHVYVGLVGPVDEMDTVLRSEPQLQRPEILSLVTTGRTDVTTISSEEVVASGLGTVGSILSEELIGESAQSLLGLNRFAIDPVIQPNANPAARITVGKQITRDLAFTYSTNVGSEQDQSAIAEYTVSNRFSAVASFTQGSTLAGGSRKNNDFTIEVRGRKRFSLGFERDATAAATLPGGAPAASFPIERRTRPEADVTVEPIPDVKLSDRRIRELLPVETDGFSRPLARLGERNLTNYLQEKGYFFATVNSRCVPADCSGPDLNLVYDVEAGQRHELKDIRIEGTDLLDVDDVRDDLQSQEASPFFGRIPFVKNLPLIGGYARGILSDDRIRRDRRTIAARMRDLGFRSARVRARVVPGADPLDLALVFQVEPGPRSTLAEVTFKGNSVLTSDDLLSDAPAKVGEPYSPSAARETTQYVKRLYADRGYLEATAQYTIVELDTDRVSLVYDVSEGDRAQVAEIAITGYTKTHEGSIRRFVDVEVGDVLTPTDIRNIQRDLYATGAFSEVAIRAEPIAGGDPGARRLSILVTEAKPLLLIYGLGYSTDDGPRGLTQLTHTNLFGRVNTASLRLRLSPNQQFVLAEFTDLRPFGTRWATTFSAFYDRNSNLHSLVERNLVGGGTTRDDRGFGIDRLVGLMQVERKLSEITSIRFRYNYESTKLFNTENIPLREIARNAQAIRLGMLSAGFTRDSRDSAIDPTEGQLMSAEYSLAARALGGEESFNKLYADYQCYRMLSSKTPVLRDSVLAFSARIGLAAPFDIEGTGPNGRITKADRQVPISQRFFAGGSTTLRGFRFEQAGPQGILYPRNAEELTTLVPLGGNALAIFNFELRYPLTENLRLVPFYDLGNVFRTVSDMSFGGMTHTIGLGLRVKTPIGPVGVDYGRLLDPPFFRTVTGEILRQPRWAFHVRFGQSF
jgi:outer membrane protein assembly complex protein YaeT